MYTSNIPHQQHQQHQQHIATTVGGGGVGGVGDVGGVGQEYVTQVELFIECRNLKNRDLLSRSDPLVSLQVPAGGGAWREIGRTEIIKDNLNPQFSRSFVLEYRFEEIQPLLFRVYDIDNVDGKTTTTTTTTTLDGSADYLGHAQCTLGEICGTPSHTLTKRIEYRPGVSGGVIILRAVEVVTSARSRDQIVLEIIGAKLPKKDLFGLSDPYYCIYKQFAKNQHDTAMMHGGGGGGGGGHDAAAAIDSSWVKVHQSEIITMSLNPRWKRATVNFAKLCNGNEHLPLKIDVWDWNRNSAHDYIGEVVTTLHDLKSMHQSGELQLMDDRKKKQKSGKGAKGAKPAGKLQVKHCEHVHNYTFLEYLNGGCDMSLVVAVDWTGSNGHPSDPKSLHYINAQSNPLHMNEYEQAIRSIGDIVSQYTTRKSYPTYGFGGKLPNGQVSHCFALNGNGANPECNGVEGILTAYKQALFSGVQLWGPTWFNAVVRQACSHARQGVNDQQRQRYFVLLIITDGVINDMTETIKAVIDASNLPLSIVIVGVGQADFTDMNTLDADDRKLSCEGRVALRDCVQFVPFRKFRGNYHQLAKETMAEIPQQVTEYFKLRGIRPNPAPEYVYREPSFYGGQPVGPPQPAPPQPQPQPQPQLPYGGDMPVAQQQLQQPPMYAQQQSQYNMQYSPPAQQQQPQAPPQQPHPYDDGKYRISF